MGFLALDEEVADEAGISEFPDPGRGRFEHGCGQLQRLGGIPLIVIPFAGFMLSRLSLLLPAAWFTPAGYDALRYSPWNRLALWEWIAAIGTYLFLGLLLTLPKEKS